MIRIPRTPRTDEFVRYMNYQFPGTVGHLPLHDKVAAIELDLNAALDRIQQTLQTFESIKASSRASDEVIKLCDDAIFGLTNAGVEPRSRFRKGIATHPRSEKVEALRVAATKAREAMEEIRREYVTAYEENAEESVREELEQRLTRARSALTDADCEFGVAELAELAEAVSYEAVKSDICGVLQSSQWGVKMWHLSNGWLAWEVPSVGGGTELKSLTHPNGAEWHRDSTQGPKGISVRVGVGAFIDLPDFAKDWQHNGIVRPGFVKYDKNLIAQQL